MKLVRSCLILMALVALPGAATVYAQGAANTATSRTNQQHNVTDTTVAKCVTQAGKPCTAAQVKEVLEGYVNPNRKGMAAIKLELASADGTMKCEQQDGSACTEQQVQAVAQSAASKKYNITYSKTYNASHSNTSR